MYMLIKGEHSTSMWEDPVIITYFYTHMYNIIMYTHTHTHTFVRHTHMSPSELYTCTCWLMESILPPCGEDPVIRSYFDTHTHTHTLTHTCAHFLHCIDAGWQCYAVGFE